ncbi:MAG: radical SAM protein [Mangrovicoccus sp.]
MKDDIPRLVRKFDDPYVTADGQNRAQVALEGLSTLWFNTGTLCNIACGHCYIESSPKNDRLAYLSAAEVAAYLDELDSRQDRPAEIGFTGGEPFLNPDILAMLEDVLRRGYQLLILTNAMQPMMRPRLRQGLERLQKSYPGQMTFRVSLDHFTPARHDEERGEGCFAAALAGMHWLQDQGIALAVAGRYLWHDSEAEMRAGFAKLFEEEALALNAMDPGQTVLFPEMDETTDVPEITEACWGILGKSPSQVMCASSRMVVKRKDAQHPTVLACTLLAYDRNFELGETLAEADRPVQLNHRHCAKFCVLGGASCSA